MRREYFTTTTRIPDDGEPARPTIELAYDGPIDELRSAIEDDAGGSLDPVDLGGAAVLLELPRVDDEE